MNSCVLMAKIVRSPELRYTQENQIPIAQMLVEFSGLKPEDPPSTLKVVGWGGLATEIHEKYAVGDRVILEGRLEINTIDRPEGFKEKRAELTISKIYHLEADHISSSSSDASNVISMESYQTNTTAKPDLKPVPTPMQETPVVDSLNPEEKNLDEIPF